MILVVDDEAFVREATVGVVQKVYNAKIDQAADGAEAIERFMARKINFCMKCEQR